MESDRDSDGGSAAEHDSEGAGSEDEYNVEGYSYESDGSHEKDVDPRIITQTVPSNATFEIMDIDVMRRRQREIISDVADTLSVSSL